LNLLFRFRPRSALLFGGAGNDTLTGGTGDDQVFGEAGNDRMIWNPGEGTDPFEGGDGTDTAEVNGGNGDEIFTITANGGGSFGLVNISRYLEERRIPTRTGRPQWDRGQIKLDAQE
jgi:Ca2+-binding RTX toxin-like protein